jgi:hypothetical protein
MTDRERIDRFVSEVGRVFHAPNSTKRETTKMAFEQRDNSSSIFVNDNKQEDAHSDRSGSAKIDGVTYWVNGWLKKTKDGKPYLSLSFKRKDEAKSGGGLRKQDIDDEIPFAPEWR